MTVVVNGMIALILLILSQGARADLLACLGKEELKIHRNHDSGPIYHLNRFFVNRLVSGNKPVLKREYQNKICGRRRDSPSVALLKHLLLVGERIFVDVSVAPLERETFRAFFVFLLKIQEMASSHQCLEKHLPHYSHFIHRYKHLESEEGAFLKEKEKLSDMFKVLGRLNFLLAKCRKDGVGKRERGKP